MMLVIAFGVVFVLCAALSLWSLGQVRRFVQDTPIIADEGALQRYKEFVRVQMYLALVAVCFLIPTVVLSIVIGFRYGLLGLAAVLAVNGGIFALGQLHKSWELRARGLHVAAPELAEEYRRVSETWVKKPFPDF